MNWKTTAALLVALGSPLGNLAPMTMGQDKPAAATKPSPFKTNQEKASYVIGIQIGRMLKSQGIDVLPETFQLGVTDSLNNVAPQISDQEAQQVMMELQKTVAAKQNAGKAVEGEKNAKEGEAFLAENAKKEGVKVLPSGLQYKVIKTGTGKMPKSTDTVSTHYQGTLLSGKVFDSSIARNEPAEFPVTGVIPGWTEALQLMHEGDKWQLFIPAKLGYGERGAGQDIGPNSTLIFEIELLKVK